MLKICLLSLVVLTIVEVGFSSKFLLLQETVNFSDLAQIDLLGASY